MSIQSQWGQKHPNIFLCSTDEKVIQVWNYIKSKWMMTMMKFNLN